MTVAAKLIGQRFSKLVVVARSANDRWGLTQWYCKCDCGKTCVVSGACLKQLTKKGKIVSCGCFREKQSRKHNHRKAPQRDLPRGVYYILERDGYRASISIAEKTKHLGYYATAEEASKAYLKKVAEIG